MRLQTRTPAAAVAPAFIARMARMTEELESFAESLIDQDDDADMLRECECAACTGEAL